MKILVLIATFHRERILLVRGIVHLGANVEIVCIPGHLQAARHKTGMRLFERQPRTAKDFDTVHAVILTKDRHTGNVLPLVEIAINGDRRLRRHGAIERLSDIRRCRHRR